MLEIRNPPGEGKPPRNHPRVPRISSVIVRNPCVSLSWITFVSRTPGKGEVSHVNASPVKAESRSVFLSAMNQLSHHQKSVFLIIANQICCQNPLARHQMSQAESLGLGQVIAGGIMFLGPQPASRTTPMPNTAVQCCLEGDIWCLR